jgi:hypothetical protein
MYSVAPLRNAINELVRENSFALVRKKVANIEKTRQEKTGVSYILAPQPTLNLF